MDSRLDTHGEPFVIRPALPPDAAAIQDILFRLAADGELILVSPGEVDTDSCARREDLARAAANPQWCYVAVATRDDEVVGMLDMRVVPLEKCSHVMELGIGILAHARDRGIGAALMEHAVEHARASGIRKVRLFVIEGNDRAIHLYAKMGFKETGRFLNEVRVEEDLRDLIIMEKEVA